MAEKKRSSFVKTQSKEPCDFLFKLLMLGDAGVGKSCILLRYSEDAFDPNFIATIGIDYRIKTITIAGKRVRLQVWDTSGQERFRSITTSFFKGSHGVLLCYDITDATSFKSVRSWIKTIDENADVGVEKILLGNKCDMKDKRVVQTSAATALAKEHNMKFFETSAKDYINIDEAFTTIATDIHARMIKTGTGGAAGAGGKGKGGVDLDGNGGSSSGGGCCGSNSNNNNNSK